MTQQTTSIAEQIGRKNMHQVVHRFYTKLTNHPQMQSFFSGIEDFERHEQRITDFWWTAMGGKLESPPQPGIDMIGKHFPLGIKQEDLELWLVIFGETLGEQLDDKFARIWMDKALQIGARLKQIIIDHKPMGLQLGDPS